LRARELEIKYRRRENVRDRELEKINDRKGGSKKEKYVEPEKEL
jgi:hypothetical protein